MTAPTSSPKPEDTMRRLTPDHHRVVPGIRSGAAAGHLLMIAGASAAMAALVVTAVAIALT
jgi:hypothetical protein